MIYLYIYIYIYIYMGGWAFAPPHQRTMGSNAKTQAATQARTQAATKAITQASHCLLGRRSIPPSQPSFFNTSPPYLEYM